MQRACFLLFCCLLLAGCARRAVYVPVTQNTPLFDSAKEVRATANLSINHAELQGAYNPSKRFASAVNIQFGAGVACYDAALGWYGSRKGVHYEVFLGAGYNSNIQYREAQSQLSFLSRNKNGSEILSLYTRYYLQPAIGYRHTIPVYNIEYCLSLSARLSYLRFQRFTYREIDAALTTNPNEPVYTVDRDYRKTDLFLFEPCFTNTVGKGKWALLLQLQYLTPWTDKMDLRNTRFAPDLLFSGGIQYRIRKTRRPILPSEED